MKSMKKLKMSDVEQGQVNIRAIRNKELKKNAGKLVEKQK